MMMGDMAESDSTEEESYKVSFLKATWQCCSQDESEWLGSDVLVTRNGTIPSESILGRYDKHFDIYPWYKGSRIFQDSRRVCTCNMEAIGFGFITLDIPGVEDILKSSHIINGKIVAISRTIFVGDLPKTVNEDEFEQFFSKFGKVVEHYIVRFSNTMKSPGFGFIIFDSDKDAADLAAMESIYFAGVAVKIKQAVFDKCTSTALFDKYYARILCGDLGGHSGSVSTDKGLDLTEERFDKDSPLKPIWPCCFQDESEWLRSDVLITRCGTISSQSILGRYDKHFDMYSWYKGSGVINDSRRVFTRDIEAIGFGFTTLDIPGVEDILKSTHIINGKIVAISRTIFVGNLPKTVNEDEFELFFSKFGKVMEHYIVRYSKTQKSTDFGFIIFDSDKDAADLAAMESIHFAGAVVKIKQAAFDKCTSSALIAQNYAATFCEDLGNHFGRAVGGSSGADLTDRESYSTEEESDNDSPLKPRWPCCSCSQWLGSDVLITKNGIVVSSQSILGRYDKHFDMCPWYRGSRVLQVPRRGFTRDMEAIGFCFMTLDIPGVEDILKSTHIINGKKIAISRTIFVGDLPKTVNDDEFEQFFSKFGKVVEHYIERCSKTGKSAGFGFIIFDSYKDAVDVAAMEFIHFAGVAVKIKQAAFEKWASALSFVDDYGETGDLCDAFGAGFGGSGAVRMMK